MSKNVLQFMKSSLEEWLGEPVFYVRDRPSQSPGTTCNKTTTLLIICLIWFDLNITKIHVYCLNPRSGLRICLSSLVGDDRILYWPWFDWVWIDLTINMIKHSLIFSDVDDSVFTVSQSFGWVVSTQLFDEGGGVLSYPPWEFYYIYTFQDNVICFHWIRSRKWRTEKLINTK